MANIDDILTKLHKLEDDKADLDMRRRSMIDRESNGYHRYQVKAKNIQKEISYLRKQLAKFNEKAKHDAIVAKMQLAK